MPCHPCGDEKTTLLGWVSPYFLGSWNWIISHPAGVTNTFILWVIWLAPTPYVFLTCIFPQFSNYWPQRKKYTETESILIALLEIKQVIFVNIHPLKLNYINVICKFLFKLQKLVSLHILSGKHTILMSSQQDSATLGNYWCVDAEGH